jgi:hypothetical protein
MDGIHDESNRAINGKNYTCRLNELGPEQRQDIDVGYGASTHGSVLTA